MLEIVIPSKEKLIKERAINISNLNPSLDNWGGWLGEDEKGIYTYELLYKRNNLKPLKGDRIYLNEFYQNIERKIIKYYKKAKITLLELSNKTNINCIKTVFALINFESILIILKRIHSKPFDDEMVLTDERLQEVVLNEAAFNGYVNYLSDINSLKVKTPLGIGNLFKDSFKLNFDTNSIVNYSNFSLEDFTPSSKYLN